jgi:hypothetical protein
MEKIGLGLLIAAAVLLLLAWLLFLRAGFRIRWYWGVGILVFPPLALVFALTHRHEAALPMVVLVLGLATGVAPYPLNHFFSRYVDLGPREKIVDGERHITLTGWDRKDYELLRSKPDTVVLQMANADVNDGTLAYLHDMTKLQELDLNDTGITDEGLVILAGLPDLQILRLRNTHITEDGLKKFLAARPTLEQLDVRGVEVKTKTLRDWKNADPEKDRRYLH